MNTLVSIENIPGFTFNKIKYYTVRFENKDKSEFFDFLHRMENEPACEDNLNDLFLWLEEIGEKEGAKLKHFRPECAAFTLPLKGNYKIKKTTPILSTPERIYCLLI